MRMILSGMQVLLEHSWAKDQAIVIENGKIRSIVPTRDIHHHLPAKQHVFPNDFYLIPGLIDLHIHGAKGCDVMDADQTALQTICKALAAEGVTGFLATTMTAENIKIENALAAVAQKIKQADSTLLGVHLEGPFLASAKSGAQCQAHLQLPNVALFNRWQEIAENNIRLVTLAPELKDAIEFIQALRKQDVIVSVGHTNATYEQTMAAIQAGCTQATHLFNAMSAMHQRQPGATAALLLANDIQAEIIADGVHVAAPMIEIAMRMKGEERLFLVTDAMRAKCMHDGEYDLGGQSVNVSAGVATLANGQLAGSTLKMPQAIKNMVAMSGCSLAAAIQMASYQPARALGLVDRKGSIDMGKDADLVVLNAKLEVMLTLHQGNELFAY